MSPCLEMPMEDVRRCLASSRKKASWRSRKRRSPSWTGRSSSGSPSRGKRTPSEARRRLSLPATREQGELERPAVAIERQLRGKRRPGETRLPQQRRRQAQSTASGATSHTKNRLRTKRACSAMSSRLYSSISAVKKRGRDRHVRAPRAAPWQGLLRPLPVSQEAAREVPLPLYGSIPRRVRRTWRLPPDGAQEDGTDCRLGALPEMEAASCTDDDVHALHGPAGMAGELRAARRDRKRTVFDFGLQRISSRRSFSFCARIRGAAGSESAPAWYCCRS